ncbi:MAG: sulfite exporter TauE/SafE family protein [Rhodothermales bacterium]
MDPLNAFILLAAGVGGGFIAGLVGVGGGIVFAPVLFYFFQSTGMAPEVIAPMTVGTSLLCTLTASSMSAWQHHLKMSVLWSVAVRVGLLSAAALFLIVAFVTTQSWYDRFAFQLVFGALLLVVSIRMFTQNKRAGSDAEGPDVARRRFSLLALGGIGSAAGTIAALAGVGGGIIMVPAYNQILRLPMRLSVGTSSGSIVLISIIGVVGYAVAGWTDGQAQTALGYVDLVHGLVLALPAIPGAQLGARVAHLVPRRLLQMAFALLAGLVAARMLITAVSGQ